MKQTAVEWYNTQLNLYGDMAFNKEISLGQYHIKKQELLDKAKEMEKEQIVKAYESLEHRHGENYYNENYNKSINNKG